MAEITVFYEGPLVSRDDARAAGLSHFFTGKPCIHGHIAQRYCCGEGPCVKCVSLANSRYRGRHPKQVLAASRRYQSQNPELCQKANRRWRAAHRQSWLESRRRYGSSPKGKVAYQRRRALKAGAPGSITPEELRRLQETTRRCHICGKPGTKRNPLTQRDHVIPLTRGGSNDLSNSALVHASCNASKGNRWAPLL
jgi:5-methylcytosine-specific restriction endonuclease McrA